MIPNTMICYIIDGDNEMKKQISWELKNGKVAGKMATVEIELITEKIVDADGYKVPVKCCELLVVASIEGIGIVGMGRPTPEITVMASIGKLGLSQTELDSVNEAITEIETSPVWQEHLAGLKRAEQAETEYDAHTIKMLKIMGQ